MMPSIVDTSNLGPPSDTPIGLWVDDRPSEILALSELLRDNGILVDIASTYAEAKAEIKNQCYDLMLVDLRLDELDGISFSRYARRWVADKYHRTVHFGAVTNFKHEYGEQSQRDSFLFVYDKGDLANGQKKRFLEDCLFSAADSRIRGEYPGLIENRVPRHVDPRLVVHVRCDVGYVLGIEGSQCWVRLWRRGSPLERTIRVFDRTFLSRRGVEAQGQPFRIDTFEGKTDKAITTFLVPLCNGVDRVRKRIAPDIDLERFR
jgi:CheY-like chemotaxis protein